MHYLPRDLINKRLRLSRAGSYRIVRANSLGLINSNHLLALLNRSRRGPQPELSDLPSDLRTAEELAAEIGDENITSEKIATWSSRKKNPPPHFRLNSHNRRYRLSAFMEWLNRSTMPGMCA